MSNYLVNLARRSAGLVPIAHPRAGPAAGPDARLLRGAGEPSVPRPPASSRGPSFDATVQHADASPRDGLVPREQATDERTRERREPGLGAPETPPKLHLVESGGGLLRPGDVPPRPSVAPPTIAEVPAPSTPHPAPVDGADRSRVAGLTVRPGAEARAAEAAAPGTIAPRAAARESVLALSHVTGPRGAAEPRSLRRDVDVRIGTIEIHAEPASPGSPAPPAVATPAPQGRPAGGFDDFVRLRTYAAWER